MCGYYALKLILCHQTPLILVRLTWTGAALHSQHLAVAAAGEAALDLLAGSSSFEGLREGGAAEGTEEYVAQVQLATEEEFDAMLLLAEVLLRSGSERARSCAGTLYSILFELCREVGASERMVCSLVER